MSAGDPSRAGQAGGEPARVGRPPPLPCPFSQVRRGHGELRRAIFSFLEDGPALPGNLFGAVGIDSSSTTFRRLASVGAISRCGDGRYVSNVSPPYDLTPSPAAILLFLAEQGSIRDIMSQLGGERGAVRARVESMVAAGTAVKVRYGVYAACEGRDQFEARADRSRSIRDAIMGELHEPRRAMEIAEGINRSVSVTTGHLHAMRKRGLVVRIGYGLYDKAAQHEGAVDPAPFARSRAQDRILAVLDREMGVDEIAAKIGCCLVMTGQILAAFRRSGQVVRVERRRYAPASDTGRAGGA